MLSHDSKYNVDIFVIVVASITIFMPSFFYGKLG